MATTESFNTSSGKEVIVNISDAGEPESITFEGITISENELFEISEYLEDYGDDDNNEDEVVEGTDKIGEDGTELKKQGELT